MRVDVVDWIDRGERGIYRLHERQKALPANCVLRRNNDKDGDECLSYLTVIALMNRHWLATVSCTCACRCVLFCC